jgi:hypothetical protein
MNAKEAAAVNGLAVLAIIAVLTGCETSQPPATLPYQRFVPIPAETVMTEGVPWHGFFALDTKTGELCTTVSYNILPKGSADDLAHSLLSCSNILQAEKEAAKGH